MNLSIPRAVSKSHFRTICPHPSMIHVNDVRRAAHESINAMKLTETYLDFIKKLDDPCVEITARPSVATFIV